eukprot:Hpha_TRINITY_DN15376_c0_g1::TRINITY_DN15376_c0_g1_i1::g.90251::m.90251
MAIPSAIPFAIPLPIPLAIPSVPPETEKGVEFQTARVLELEERERTLQQEWEEEDLRWHWWKQNILKAKNEVQWRLAVAEQKLRQRDAEIRVLKQKLAAAGQRLRERDDDVSALRKKLTTGGLELKERDEEFRILEKRAAAAEMMLAGFQARPEVVQSSNFWSVSKKEQRLFEHLFSPDAWYRKLVKEVRIATMQDAQKEADRLSAQLKNLTKRYFTQLSQLQESEKKAGRELSTNNNKALVKSSASLSAMKAEMGELSSKIERAQCVIPDQQPDSPYLGVLREDYLTAIRVYRDDVTTGVEGPIRDRKMAKITAADSALRSKLRQYFIEGVGGTPALGGGCENDDSGQAEQPANLTHPKMSNRDKKLFDHLSNDAWYHSMVNTVRKEVMALVPQPGTEILSARLEELGNRYGQDVSIFREREKRAGLKKSKITVLVKNDPSLSVIKSEMDALVKLIKKRSDDTSAPEPDFPGLAELRQNYLAAVRAYRADLLSGLKCDRKKAEIKAAALILQSKLREHFVAEHL